MAEQQPKLIFSQDDLTSLFQAYGMGDEDVPEATVEARVAKGMIDTFNSGFGTEMTYEEYRNAGVPDREIIQLLSEDPDGNPIQTGTFLQGMKREAIPTAASVPTFMGGFSLGQTLVSGVPPTTPVTAAIRIGVPLVLGSITGMAGYAIGDEIAEKVTDEPIIYPFHREKYEAGRTGTGVLAFGAMPFMLPKQLNFGVELARKTLGGQKSISTGAVDFLEKSVGRMGGTARAAPFTFGAFEGIAGAGSVAGAYGAEKAYPGQMFPRLAMEMGGGLSFSVIADLFGTRLVNGLKLIPKGVRAVKEGRVGEAIQYLGDERKRQATNYILETIEEAGEDPEEIIKRLASQEFTDLLVDENDQPINLTAGLKSGSPAILALEKALEKTAGAGVGKERASANVTATRALRNAITALYASDSPEAIQEGAVFAQAIFENELSGDLAKASRKLFDAFQAIGSPDSRQAQLGEAFQGILAERLAAARVNEKRLWRGVNRGFVIDTFTDLDGNEIDRPMFVEFLDNRLPTTKEAKDALSGELTPIFRFYKRKQEELGLLDDAEIDAELRADLDMSADESRALGRYEESLGQLMDDDRTRVEGLLERARDMDPDEAVEFLRQESQYYRTRSRDYDDPRMVQRMALTIDRAADLQRARLQAGLSRGTFEEGAGPDVANEVAGITANEIFDMYSTSINIGKKLNAQGDSNGANIAFGFARSLMDDLDAADTDDAAYNTARAYSRALNDAFTRTFANDLLADEKTGRIKILPDQVAQKIFSADAGSMRTKQLDMIGQFELTQAFTTLAEQRGDPNLTRTLNRAMKYSRDEETGLMNTARLNRWLSNNRQSLSQYPEVLQTVEGAIKTTSDIRGTLELMIRNIRANAFNPDTGEISMVGLRRWMENPNNADLLEAMPALKADLENSVTAKNLLDETAQKEREARDALKGTVSFMDLLPDATENPATAAAIALSNNQKKPVQSWDSLLNVVKNAPDEWQVGNQTYTKKDAMEGLRTAFIEAAMVKAGGSSRTFSSRTFFDTIFAPHRNSKGNVSLADWMKQNDVMSTTEINKLRTLTTELVKMESFAAKGDVNLEDIAGTVGPMMDFYLRVAGSSVGSSMQRLIPGDTGAGQLVAAGAGSKAFLGVYNKVFNQIPEALKMDVMSEMFRDPDLLAAMLAKGKTEKERQSIAKTLIKKLTEKGFIAVATPIRRAAPSVIREPAQEVDIELPEQEVNPALERARELLKAREEASNQSQPVGTPTTQAALPAPQPPMTSGAGTNPQLRQQYAALFPNDPISGMLVQRPRTFRRGGIASLME